MRFSLSVPSVAAALAAAGVALLPAVALAATEGAAPPGMPQLNPATWPSQVFWLVVLFGLLYVVMSKVALPRVGAVLEMRAEALRRDLDEAARLKTETEKAVAAYEAALAKARTEAQATAMTARNAALAEAAAARARVEADLAGRAKGAEAAIAAAKAQAMAGLAPVAEGAAKAIVARLTGSVPADADIAAAVAAARR